MHLGLVSGLPMYKALAPAGRIGIEFSLDRIAGFFSVFAQTMLYTDLTATSSVLGNKCGDLKLLIGSNTQLGTASSRATPLTPP